MKIEVLKFQISLIGYEVIMKFNIFVSFRHADRAFSGTVLPKEESCRSLDDAKSIFLSWQRTFAKSDWSAIFHQNKEIFIPENVLKNTIFEMELLIYED